MDARHAFEVLADAEGDDDRRRRRMARRGVKMESQTTGRFNQAAARWKILLL
jgi:hypothetical protein